MQCASILYPHIYKIWCFKPSLSATPLSQQQQQETSHDEKPKIITSASNPFVKHCLKLRNSSSYRRAHASALVVGATPIREIRRFQESLQDESVSMDCLILPDKAEIPDGLDKSTASIVRVSSVVMRKLSGLQTTDSLDAIALMKIPARFFIVDDDQKNYQKWFPSVHRILVLDGIQDPGNLGTLLRSAVAFRWVRNYLPWAYGHGALFSYHSTDPLMEFSFFPAAVIHSMRKLFGQAEVPPFRSLLFVAVGIIWSLSKKNFK